MDIRSNSLVFNSETVALGTYSQYAFDMDGIQSNLSLLDLDLKFVSTTGEYIISLDNTGFKNNGQLLSAY